MNNGITCRWQEKELATPTLVKQYLFMWRQISFGKWKGNCSRLPHENRARRTDAGLGCFLSPSRGQMRVCPKMVWSGSLSGRRLHEKGFIAGLDSRLRSSALVTFQKWKPFWVQCFPLQLRPVTNKSLFFFVINLKFCHQQFCFCR